MMDPAEDGFSNVPSGWAQTGQWFEWESFSGGQTYTSEAVANQMPDFTTNCPLVDYYAGPGGTFQANP